MTDNVVIAGAVRTPIGAIGGGLASLQAEDLAVACIRSLLDATGLDPGFPARCGVGSLREPHNTPIRSSHDPIAHAHNHVTTCDNVG